jgi:tetratricopeptide (TPR) repeat protein
MLRSVSRSREQRRREPPKAPAARPARPARLWWIALALVGVTFAAFAEVRHFDFVNFDDQLYVTANPQVRAGLTWAGIVWAFSSSYAANWHPLTWLSHMVDVESFGMDPGAHHLVNLALHLINTLLVWLVLRRVTGSVWRSALVAAIFGVHPLHVESVAWVAERKDVLSMFFGLLTLWAYTGYVDRRTRWRYAAALVWFALGLMAKPMLVTLPFVLLLLDIWPLRRIALFENTSPSRPSRLVVPWTRAVLEKVPFVLLVAISSIVTLIVQEKGGSVSSLETVPFGARLANVVESYINYVWNTVWPAGLAAFYPLPTTVRWAPVIGSAVLLAALTFAVLRAWRKLPYLAVGWLWFLGTLVPVIGFVRFGAQARADRYMYLPMLGLLVAGIWGMAELAERWRVPRRVSGAVAVAIVIACVVATRVQAESWRNSAALWQHALAVTTGNSRAHANLGATWAALGRQADAAAEYRAALAIEPALPQAHNNLGLALVALGNREEAIAHYRQAIALMPTYAGAHNNLGSALMQDGKLDDAIAHYGDAVRSRPDDAEFRNNLGAALATQGHLPEATREFREAVRLAPLRAEFHFSLGLACAQQGSDAEAIQEFRTALRLDPSHAAARRALSELETPSTGRGRSGRGGRGG